MKTKQFLSASAAAFCAFTILPVRVHATAIAYNVTVLDALARDTYSEGINASGQVTGSAGSLPGHYAAVWTGTTVTSLDGPGGLPSQGFSINASGQVAGVVTGTDLGGYLHAVRWIGTTPTDLGTLGGTNSQARSINDAGQVVGWSTLTGDAAVHAVLWNGTAPTDLGTLGGRDSYAWGINTTGQITGKSDAAGNADIYAVRWTGTTPTILSTLGGRESDGRSINASGQVAGYSAIAGAGLSFHAVLWTGTTPTDLGTLGGTNSYGYGINASGDVIGMSDVSVGSTFAHGFIFTGGTMYDLNTLLVPGSGVTDVQLSSTGNCINDSGQIAAFGTISGQSAHLLLTPTPEPASAVLLLGGAALLGLRRRR